MLHLLLAPALAAPCATPDVLAALNGTREASHRYAVVAPDHLDGRPRARALGKSVYGEHYEGYVDTENFTINWWDAGISRATAEAAGDALETAWTSFIEEQGWPAPVSSDRYLMWVLLDPSLGGATGYTTEYFTDDYPEGFPVIFLNPDWSTPAAFWSALSAHEFMHTIQFAMRDWEGTENGEQSWYWEASATHASELADPDWDGHQYASAWYAEQAGLRYDSVEGSHQYGMFVFNAWLEEQGPGDMLAAWEEGTERPYDTWDGIIADSSGLSLAELWGGFTGAYGNDQLVESDLYTPAATAGAAVDGAEGTLAYLGTSYLEVGSAVLVTVEGDVVLAGPDGPAATVAASTGDLVTVTALSAGADWQLAVEEDPDEGADTGPSAPGHSGGALPPQEPRGACGCATGGTELPWFAALLPVLGWSRRRVQSGRPSTSTRPQQPGTSTD